MNMKYLNFIVETLRKVGHDIWLIKQCVDSTPAFSTVGVGAIQRGGGEDTGGL